MLNSNSLAFFNATNNQLLAYEDLNVWDANNNKLPAAMHFNNGLLTIEVDDKEASYPVTIDPLNKTLALPSIMPMMLIAMAIPTWW